MLANFCFMSRVDNRKLGGEAPSLYRAKITGNVNKIMKSSVSTDRLFDDDYETFVLERAASLAAIVRELCGVNDVQDLL